MLSNLFRKMREKAYHFVDREGGFALHFMGDFIRGPSSDKDKKVHTDFRPEIPLTVEEERIFKTLLQRRKGEKQLDYWRRKRVMNNFNDKKSLVQDVIGIQKRKKQLDQQRDTVAIQKEKHRLEIQMQRIKMAKFDALHLYSNKKKDR